MEDNRKFATFFADAPKGKKIGAVLSWIATVILLVALFVPGYQLRYQMKTEKGTFKDIPATMTSELKQMKEAAKLNFQFGAGTTSDKIDEFVEKGSTSVFSYLVSPDLQKARLVNLETMSDASDDISKICVALLVLFFVLVVAAAIASVFTISWCALVANLIGIIELLAVYFFVFAGKFSIDPTDTSITSRVAPALTMILIVLLVLAAIMSVASVIVSYAVHAYETSQAEIASYTSIGTRKSQQDSICFDFGDFCTVCAVCDGMGGLTGGERASALAAHGVTRYLLEHAQAEDIPTEMGRAALRLNEEVKNLRDPANQKIEAGTTLTTVFLRNGKLFWCSIGDSHIYLYRDGTLEQLNIDHNFGAQLDQMALEGSITQDEALHHPQRAALTSYLGISELTLISGNRMPFQLRKGDVLIQCTDGLYRYLPDSTMCRILAVTGNLKQAAEQMVKTALAVPGGHDNTSVLLARYKG